MNSIHRWPTNAQTTTVAVLTIVCGSCLKTLKAVRKVWPERFPLTARLSVTDWLDGGVTIEESIELTKQFQSGWP